MQKIRVFVVDDHAVVREGLRQLLQGRDDMKLVGEAGNGKEALKKIKGAAPDVVILDISMPQLSGFDLVPLLAEAVPQARIVILSMYGKEAYVHQALSAGATGYVLKTAPGSELIGGILAAFKGETFFPREINAEVIHRFLDSEKQAVSEVSKYDLLSDREQQVFRLVIEGNSTKQIADILCLSPKTVEKHRSNISRKIGINEPLALMKYAVKIGVADPELWPEPVV